MTEEDFSDMPPVVCPKCGELVVPESIKFMPNKTFQIRCPVCQSFTMIPKDEHYEKLLNYCIEKGIVTQEDLESKPAKRKSRKKKKKEEDFDISDEEIEEMLSVDEDEPVELRILKEILAEEKSLKNYQKKHLLEWAELKTLDPNEVHSLLVGLGASDEVAKKIATAYNFMLKKEKMKREKYKEAVDKIYRDSVSPEPSFSRFEEDDGPVRRRVFSPESTIPPRPLPRASSSGFGDLHTIIELLRFVKEEFGSSRSDETLKLKEEIEKLREELRLMRYQEELEKKEAEIEQLRAALSAKSFSEEPEKIQELKVKKETLESFADRLENLATTFLDFLQKQSMIQKGILPTVAVSEEEKKSAIDKLKAAAKGR